ncbi:MAG: PadR family transcriptional regulator [Nanoarchaeota archaeon]
MEKVIHKRKRRGAEEFNKKFVMHSLDIVILTQLRQQSMSGFGIIKLVHEKFGVLLSAGTVYPMLHSLKKNGILKTTRSGKSILYKIKSEKKLDKILSGHLESYKMLKKLSKK